MITSFLKWQILAILLFVWHTYAAANIAMPNKCHSANCALKKQYLGIEANNSRSDTIDVLHYDISLNLVNLSAAANLTGECRLTIKPKINDISQILLDLEGLDITAVSVNGVPADYTHNGLLAQINLASPANISDTLDVLVHYNGNPPTASFGGFYFTATYAYNMGVGIGIDPPAFGRAWFPCVDNFIDRATYSFHITTSNTRKAFCNGLLQGVTDNADLSKTWHWALEQSIPTYLASVAVSQYETLAWDYYGVSDTIPVQIGARANDTTNCRNSFVHLNDCLEAYENAFGPYRFDRIGYVMVPFNGGAMEHATNIGYPIFAIDGTLNWESLMSHELSHHWFGNLVTCETPADMWLNEGWASYCAHYFLEAVYGKQRYLDEVRNNHDDVLRTAHIDDGGYLPVANVPFDATYGKHVYSKGADVAHTLRAYMGDNLFFDCLQQYLNEYAFKTANTDQFENFLSDCSGIDLSNYFNDWVKQPGWAHFTVAPFMIAVGNPRNYQEIIVRQRYYQTEHSYEQVPLEITYFDKHFNQHTQTVWTYDSDCSVANIAAIPFESVYMALDFNEKINDATTDYHHFIDSIGTYDYPTTRVALQVDDISDTTLLRIIHNYIPPDRTDIQVPENIILSPKHFWTVEGYKQDTFHASATFGYNGNSTGVGAYLDNTLIGSNENNLRLLYRPLLTENDLWGQIGSTWDAPWAVVNDAVIQTGTSTTDKRGNIQVPNLQFGEYALGYYSTTLSDTLQTSTPCDNYILVAVPTIDEPTPFTLKPNPSNKNCQLTWGKAISKAQELKIYNSQGKLIYSHHLAPNSSQYTLETASWEGGVYVICTYDKNVLINSTKLLIAH